MARSSIPSRTAVAGHPIHPMLIHFPVAALVGLVATDFAYIFTGDEFWARASLWLAGVGAVGGWAAGLIGLIDLVSVVQIRRLITAWSHALVAVMSLSIVTLNWLLRCQDMLAWVSPWGVTLSVVTAGLISLAGILGGQLVYEHGVGVDTDS
ncbi:DUF2231 domain-containing protein [Gilvimarinus agarilyticus]|uniref:DUF2231 domain-containing protein n=1 Tax=Gilvimarinus sp. 2_MG-2023 TaxID=3062666 RepID=UPI001C095D7D|nr:DUF2231 domain-containing protein [Gilvimarinus sp. 2_MG-2023]MBU2886503.1 DUF2231 domain-containing protein [Gilvimarinus agarilyticus]MDO6571171.1 DUF2231 domain-containing protein [Gilvimarinus sp. 2_MG-2023]